ncbi:hypothetical protein [Saccharibacillus alkalitolerans]|uniref:Uncharacterized protein n=1 Tax=Saccharibacillus alkalitolerans TaxID=2705290 RepID=A0ABX0F8R9_9BACL|nr:hypothetical protein [Saccharibacillus alkalitolerans]NGZ77356.1 hypothetical protein [Saccharibacillus alkalitolerans]
MDAKRRHKEGKNGNSAQIRSFSDSPAGESEKLLPHFGRLGIHKKAKGLYNADVSPFNTTLTWSLRLGGGSLFMGFSKGDRTEKPGLDDARQFIRPFCADKVTYPKPVG